MKIELFEHKLMLMQIGTKQKCLSDCLVTKITESYTELVNLEQALMLL